MEDQKRQLFSALTGAIADEEYEQALEIITKILSLGNGADADAIAARLFCLIELGRFEDALTVTDGDGDGDSFEKAYCLYRLQRLDDAMEVADRLEASVEVQQLRAQILYRQESFAECLEVYSSLFEDHNDDDELAVNLRAAQAMAAVTNTEMNAATGTSAVEFDASASDSHSRSWEYYFNGACFNVALQNYELALELLTEAELLCRHEQEQKDKSEEEGMDQDAVPVPISVPVAFTEELAPILTQKAYILQCLGRASEAADLYAKVVSFKPADVAVSAVANNNTVALRHDRDLFDSLKKMRNADSEVARKKLTRVQRRKIGFNHVLLYITMNKTDDARRLLAELEAEAEAAAGGEGEGEGEGMGLGESLNLIAAALAYHEKRHADVDALLTKTNDTRSLLALAHTRVVDRKYVEAAETLLRVTALAHQPALVSTAAALLVAAGADDRALQVIEDAVEHWKKADASAASEADVNGVGVADADEVHRIFLLLLRQLGGFLMDQSRARYSEAAKAFETAYALDRGDVATLANLVFCLSKCDVSAAERYAEYLPAHANESEEGDDGIDIDRLEAVPPPRREMGREKAKTKTKEKSEGGDADADADGDADAEREGGGGGDEEHSAAKKKRKKKRKIRLPKNIDPRVPIDPERWLPMTERSYYKKKHGRRHYGAKAQGAAAPAGEGARDRDKDRRRGGGSASGGGASAAAAAAAATSTANKVAGRKKGKGKGRRR